jgi:hypothetical protein
MARKFTIRCSLIASLCALVALLGFSSPADASRGVHRVGGKVHSAWPVRGKAPRTQLARWLARQAGPCRHAKSKHKGHKRAKRHCAKPSKRGKRHGHRGAKRRSASVAVAARMTVPDPGAPARKRVIATVSASTASNPLALTRSYEIPAGDPSYNRLLNWAWTYDSATAAAAFISTGDKAQATQLLDQLAALQFTDGSIDIAFNVATGQGAGLARSSTVGWLGLAAASYDSSFGGNRYLSSEKLAANFLLSLQGPTGLIRGGPDVNWSSTLHNLLAYTFLVRLGDELSASGDSSGALRYRAAATSVASGIDSNLIYQDTGGAHFLQGLNDTAEAFDTQTIGAMYLVGHNEPDLAQRVLSYAQTKFAVSGRSIVKSLDPATYNNTYAASGPFSGYMPSRAPGAPTLMTFEDTATMRQAMAALGQDTTAIDQGAAAWRAINAKDAGAPLQADRTFADAKYGYEYHVWPAAASAASWVLAQNAPKFFSAPLPPSSLITSWNKLRGGNLITTSPDGRVEMTVAPGGERRVIAAGSSGSDYTITANATLQSGDGWGIFLRATTDSQTNLTGYSVQLDHNFGQVVLRQRDTEQELSVPLARANVPAGFVWFGQPHVLTATVNGNTLTASVDGTQVMNVPDLATASAAARLASTGVTKAFVPPTSGGYGLRSWGSGIVSFQPTTVG